MSTPIALKFGKDANNLNAYAPIPSNNKTSATLTNGNAVSFTVPYTESLWLVSFRFQPGTTVWIDATGVTAAEPAGASFANTTSEMNPASLTVAGGTVISCITAFASADVSVVMWQVGNP